MRRETPATTEVADESERDTAGPQPELASTVSMRRDLPLMYSAQALRYLAPMILVPFYGRILGIESYGHLLSAMALMQIVWLLVEWGLPSTGFLDAGATASNTERGELLGRQIAGRLLLAGVVVPFAVAVITLIPALRADFLVSLLALALGVVSAFNLTWYFQGLGKMRIAAVMEAFGMGSSTLLILLFMRSPHQAWVVPGALLLVSIVSTTIQYWLAAKSLPGTSIRLKIPFASVRQSTWLFFDRGQTMLLGPLAIFSFGLVGSAQAVAAFAVADRLMNVGLALLQPLNQIFSIRLIQSAERLRTGHPPEDTYRIMRKLSFYSFSFYTLIGSIGIFTASLSIPLIFGAGFDTAIPIFRILCLALIILGGVSALVTCVLFPLRYERDIALISTVRLVTSCVGVMLLGYAGGGDGAAWGRAFGAGLTFGMVVIALDNRSLWRVLVRR